MLGDAVGGDGFGFYFHFHRLVHPLLGHVENFRREGGGEQQGLPVAAARRHAHYAAHLWDKPHVQHAVGFVDHQHFNLIQMHILIAAEIQQAARGGHQNIHPFAVQFFLLFAVIHAAHQGVYAEA